MATKLEQDAEDKGELSHTIEPAGNTAVDSPATWMPRVYLDVSKDQLNVLEVGNEVVIELRGIVRGLQQQQNGNDGNSYEVSLELKEVSIDPKENEFTRLAEDD